MFTFAAFVALVTLLARMNHEVQRELFLPFECLQTNVTYERSFGIMRLLVTCQMVLAFECGIANVADESGEKRRT